MGIKPKTFESWVFHPTTALIKAVYLKQLTILSRDYLTPLCDTWKPIINTSQYAVQNSLLYEQLNWYENWFL